MADSAEPLMIAGGKIQAFTARCLEHSATISAMLVVNEVEFRQLMIQSEALVAVLDRSMEFTDETLKFLEAIAADLHALSAIVIEEHRRRSRLEAALNQQETDGP